MKGGSSKGVTSSGTIIERESYDEKEVTYSYSYITRNFSSNKDRYINSCSYHHMTMNKSSFSNYERGKNGRVVVKIENYGVFY